MSNVNILTLKEYWANVSNAVANVGSAIKGQAIQVAGSDGTNARIIKTNANGEVLTQLSGRKLEVKSTSYGQNLNVAPEANTTITIIPPVGELWRVKLLRLQVPKLTSGTTGNHVVSIMTTIDSSACLVLEANNVYSEIIDIMANSIITASVKLPTTETAQQNAIQSIVATNAAPIFIKYANRTDVIQNGRLLITLNREVEYIA